MAKRCCNVGPTSGTAAKNAAKARKNRENGTAVGTQRKVTTWKKKY